MPQELLTEIRSVATAAAVVASVAVPVGVAAVLVAKSGGRRLWPRWRVPAAPRLGHDLPTAVSDFGYVLLVAVLFVGYPVLVAAGTGVLAALGLVESPVPSDELSPLDQLRANSGVLIAAPMLGLLWLWLRHRAEGFLLAVTVPQVARQVALGVAVWVVVTPAVFATHFLATWVSEQLGAVPDKHPFSRLTDGLSVADQLLFGVIVCLFTPLAEEVLFRGLFIGWTGGRWYRPWVVLLLGAVLFVVVGNQTAPLVFLALLALGLYAIQRVGSARPGFPSRTVIAVYTTSVLFAVAHSRVWPSPIPLFVLALALGYLATRTNRIGACVVLHGLFNAVSYVMVLRGGAE